MIYTLSLHDALPIFQGFYLFESSFQKLLPLNKMKRQGVNCHLISCLLILRVDRKSTRLNSSHQIISYAVFCLKKKINMLVDAITSIHNHCMTIFYN